MAEQTLRVGDTAPDFEAATDSGDTVKLSDYRGKRVVLYFYPKDDEETSPTHRKCGFIGRMRSWGAQKPAGESGLGPRLGQGG